MDFLGKVDKLMREKGLNKMRLSQLTEIPYSTIVGFYKKGYENAKISTIKKLAYALGVSLDYLIGDEDAVKAVPAPATLDSLLESYYQLNDEGREKLAGYAADLARARLQTPFHQEVFTPALSMFYGIIV